MPQRERVPGMNVRAGQVVHDPDGGQRAGLVQLADPGQVEERVADRRPQAPADRARRPPKQARERRSDHREAEGGPHVVPAERADRRPKGCRERQCQRPAEDADAESERPGNSEEDRENGEDEHQAPSEGGRERGANVAWSSDDPEEAGAWEKQDAARGSG